MTKKYLASRYVNQITFREPGKPLLHPRFTVHDTWEEAHAALLLRASNRLKDAEKELAAATRNAAKVKGMKP